MFRLCTLIFTLTLVTELALAATQTFTASIEADSRSGPLDIGDLNRQFKVSQVSEQIQYRVDELFGGVNLQAGLTLSQPDYSSISVLNENGEASLLSESVTSKNELIAQLGTDIVLGTHSLSLGVLSSVSESPFATQSASLTYTKSFFSQTTQVGGDALYATQDQPESFFTDIDFSTKARPRKINSFALGLFHEQFLTSNWKMRNRIGLSQRVEERPQNISLQSKHGYALSDTLFAEAQVSYVDELSRIALKNERGYFKTWGYKVGLNYEIVYDFLVSASYGMLIERETDPRTELSRQIASDQYGLGLQYLLGKMTLNAQGVLVQTNTQIKNLRISGGLAWTL